MPINPLVNIAVRAARSAGDFISRNLARVDEIPYATKEANDYVSEIDRGAEERIIEIIQKSYPEHAILAEESGSHGESDTVWIIDPLDGTTNFLHGFPQFAVSIGIRHKGRMEHGVVYDPISQEMYTASRGGGAYLNNRRIRVAGRKGLTGSLLGTGFPFKDHTHLDAYLLMFRALIQSTAGIRRPGSAALDLAYVAAGRLDGFWEIGLRPWDIAAGILLIQEAGGIVGNLSGGPEVLASGNVVAGNPKIFAELIKSIRPHLTPELSG